MKTYEFTLLLSPDSEEGGFQVTCPALQGVVSEGDSEDEAIVQGTDAARAIVQSMLNDGQEVPENKFELEPQHNEKLIKVKFVVG